jgi:undecaprenyl-diphosphatase
MPTMTAAFAHDLIEARQHLGPERVGEIAIGFVFAFAAAAVVVRPFLAIVRRVGFGPFAWYRIAAGALILAALGMGLL